MALNYEYTAYDGTGELIKGTVQASNEQEALIRIREQGYFPSAVEVAKVRQPLFQRTKRLGADDLSLFARQFAIMLDTGMPVIDCLDILIGQQPNVSAKEALQEVRREVGGGQSLAMSLRDHPRIFPEMFVNMVDVGEASGNLPSILQRMAAFYEREAKMRGDIKQATTYPTVIVAFAFVAIGAVMFVVLPTFANMFAEFDVELPLITRVVMDIRDFIVNNILFVLPAFGLMAWGAVVFFRTPRGTRLLDRLLLRIPKIGELISQVIFARFARTLGLLYTSGLSMVDSLQSCESIVGNVVVADDIAKARAGVQRGEGIAGPLRAEAEAFPFMLTEMIAVGEETGSLDQVLDQIADFYEREVEQAIKGLTSVIEPLIMIVLGGIVFMIVLSVFVPMFEMVNVIE